jgi:hypothetical protein
VRVVLYVAALVATERNPGSAFYLRLLAAGKAQELALMSCMRKPLTILNAMAETRTRRQVPHALAATFHHRQVLTLADTPARIRLSIPRRHV